MAGAAPVRWRPSAMDCSGKCSGQGSTWVFYIIQAILTHTTLKFLHLRPLRRVTEESHRVRQDQWCHEQPAPISGGR